MDEPGCARRVSGGLQLPLSAAPLQVTPPQAMSQQRLSGPVDALALIHDVAHGHNFSGLSDMLGSGRPSALLPVGSLTNPVGSLLLPGGPWGAPEPPPAPHRCAGGGCLCSFAQLGSPAMLRCCMHAAI